MIKMLINEKAQKKYTIDDIFSSKGRIKIIRLLAIEDELNISEIVKRTKLNHKIVSNHLQILKELGIVQEKKYGRIKIYRFRSEDFKVKAIKNLILIWESY